MQLIINGNYRCMLIDIALILLMFAFVAEATHSAFPNGIIDITRPARPYHRHFTALRKISRRMKSTSQNPALVKEFLEDPVVDGDMPVYGDLEALKGQLDDFTPIGQGKRGIVHRAHLTSDRLLNAGKEIKAGTEIALKTVPAHLVQDEIEALTRLSVLRDLGMTDLYPELYGVFFSQNCNIMPKRRGRRQRQVVPGFDDVSCATIELELVDKTFLEMFYNRWFFDEKEHTFFDNSIVQPVPDSIILELILGELAAATHAGLSVVDRNPGNYAVKKVDYWRKYIIKTQTAKLEIFLPPGLSARRIDCGIWQNIDEAQQQGQDPISFFRNEFAKQYLVSENVAHAFNELASLDDVAPVLQMHFSQYMNDVTDKHKLRTFEIEF